MSQKTTKRLIDQSNKNPMTVLSLKEDFLHNRTCFFKISATEIATSGQEAQNKIRLKQFCRANSNGCK